MTRFSRDWLALREPLDTEARSRIGAADLGAPERAAEGLRVVDLGAGTGANLRFLAPLLGGAQDWLLVDGDDGLLDSSEGALRAWARSTNATLVERGGELTVQSANFQCRVRRMRLDLAAALDSLALPARALISASALLDLVSEHWLTALAKRCERANAFVLFALTYDGRMECRPAEPEDGMVRELFNRHQRTDKGFGPALGPSAAALAAQILGGLGYDVRRSSSDWHAGARHRALQSALVDGWCAAALELAPRESSMLGDWRARRQAHIESGRSELTVGHVDLIGSPPR